MQSYNPDPEEPRSSRSRTARRGKAVSDTEAGEPSLSALCEPFFCDVCTILKEGATSKANSGLTVRTRLVGRLDQMYSDSGEGSAALAEDYVQIEGVLAFFADDVIMCAGLAYSDRWRDQMLLASHPRIGIVDGAARFFSYLEMALKEPPARASQILAVYLTCLGLGFAGIHRHSPEPLRAYSSQILQRLDANVANVNAADPICANLYNDRRQALADARDLFKPVREKVLVIGLVFTALVICCLCSYFAIFFEARDQIKSTFGRIKDHSTLTIPR